MKEGNMKFAGKMLTTDEILGQAWVFLIAGYETTATTLGFMSHNLAVNPDCQERLYDELITALGPDGEIGYDELQQLPYLDACICETLRLFPPIPRVEREANSNFKLGDTGIQFHKGLMVEIPVYVIHHSEEYYQNAEQFDPERFMPENRHKIIPYTFLPFGTGPRNCIGMRFALMEIKLAMAHIITRYRFKTTDQTKQLKFMPVTPLLSASNLSLTLEKR